MSLVTDFWALEIAILDCLGFCGFFPILALFYSIQLH